MVAGPCSVVASQSVKKESIQVPGFENERPVRRVMPSDKQVDLFVAIKEAISPFVIGRIVFGCPPDRKIRPRGTIQDC